MILLLLTLVGIELLIVFPIVVWQSRRPYVPGQITRVPARVESGGELVVRHIHEVHHYTHHTIDHRHTHRHVHDVQVTVRPVGAPALPHQAVRVVDGSVVQPRRALRPVTQTGRRP